MIRDAAEKGFGNHNDTHAIGAEAFTAEAAKLGAQREKMVALYTDLHGKYADNPAWNVPLNNMYNNISKLDTEISQLTQQAESYSRGTEKRKLAEAGIEGGAAGIKFSDDMLKKLKAAQRAERLAQAMPEPARDTDDEGLDAINGPQLFPAELRQAQKDLAEKLKSSDDVAAQLLGRNQHRGLRSNLGLPGANRRNAA